MIAAKTVVSLACLIANKGVVDTSAIEAQLNDAEKAQIATVIQSGTCLPKSFEQVLKETQENSGLNGLGIPEFSAGMPTKDTLTGAD